MSSEWVGILGLVLMFAMILAHIPIGVAMALSGIITVAALIGWDPALAVLPIETFHQLASPDLALIVLFLLMGNLAGLAGLSQDLYRLAQSLVGHRHGGLAMTTVGASAAFGAVCGSSIATTATMTRLALPEMQSRGYEPSFAAGSIAAGATLGIIVPPSLVLVLYGLLTEQPINTLFIAALVPAAIAVVLQLSAIIFLVKRNPALGPASARSEVSEKLNALKRSVGFFILAALVSGGIYSGLFTVSEAASVGAITALFFAVIRRRITRKSLRDTLDETASSTAMIYLVLIGASVFSYGMALSNLPATMVEGILSLGLPALAIILLLELIYILLGAIFDTVAAMVVTLPFVFPVITSLGYDPIWWGIINVIVMEIGMITPPFGMNVFVMKGMAPDLPLGQIYRGVAPFVGADLIRLLLLTLVPALTLWLPGALAG